MEKNEDKIKYLKTIADGLITHYLKNNFPNATKLEKELDRIHTIIDEATITIKNYIPGSPTQASNGSKEITLYVKDKENISLDELKSSICNMIHEFYHSISGHHKIDYIFLEEGYVTEITAETIRYAIENPIDIGNINKEDLVAILKELNWENAYATPSEFVRSTQVIMQNYGYNSMFEYIFSENALTRLYEIAKDISPEYGDIMKRQDMKNIKSINYESEKNFFLKMFDKIDFTTISETSIEMNSLLQNYLTDKGLIYENPRLYDIVNKYNPKYVAYREFYKENSTLPQNELFSKIESELNTFDFEYHTQNNRIEDVKRMLEIISKGYEHSTIKPNMFPTLNYFAKLIAYDMYQRGMQTPTDKQVEEYSNYLVFDSKSEKIMLDMVLSELENTYKKSDDGIKISEIINQSIANQTFFGILGTKEIESLNPENYWEKVQKVADLASEQKEQNGENFYLSFYYMLLKMTKKCINPDKIYSQKDYEEFKSQMSQVFNSADVPIDIMTELGLTPDKLFFKTISENINFENRTEQTISLLEIAKNNMDFGKRTNDLQDFTMHISNVYEELENGDNQELKEHFINTLLESYYATLQESTTIELRKGQYTYWVENPYIKKILDGLVLNPKTYNNPNKARQMFEQYPELYRRTTYNPSFRQLMINDLPKNMQEQLKGNDYIFDEDIINIIIGKRFPDLEDITTDKLEQIGHITKFKIIYDKYHELIENGDTDKAEEFWKTFYKTELSMDNNNVAKRSLFDETLQLIEESPDAVTQNSIKEVTTKFRDEILETKDTIIENKGR